VADKVGNILERHPVELSKDTKVCCISRRAGAWPAPSSAGAGCGTSRLAGSSQPSLASQAEIDAGQAPGTTSADATRLAEL
jgi:hypothetical protein